MKIRYDGTLSPTWTVSAAFSQGTNHFDESGFANLANIVDYTQEARGAFSAIGRGFFEVSRGTTYRWTGDTSKQVAFLGNHTFGFGYQYQRAFFKGTRSYSGRPTPFLKPAWAESK